MLSNRPALILDATIRCPACGLEKLETMPMDACVHFYECTNCHALVRPKPGDCCVFCSYGFSQRRCELVTPSRDGGI